MKTKREGKRMTKKEQSDTQRAFRSGFIGGSMEGMLFARKKMAKEIYSKMYDFAYRTKSYYTDALNDIIAKIDETFNDFRIELESLLREYYVEVEE